MELSDRRIDSVVIMKAAGRIDMITSDAFRERLLELVAGALPVGIDLSGVG